MQRATKESQATATVDPRWPFQMKNKESKDKGEEAEREEKTKAELKEATMEKERKKTHIDEFVRKLAEPFKPVVEPWESWVVAVATQEADGSSPQTEKPKNEKGQTEYEFFCEKIEKCTEAIPDLTPRHKEQVEAFVERFGPLYPTKAMEEMNILAAVDIESSSISQSSASDTESDGEGLDGLSEEMRVEVQENRKRIICWLTGHKALYGKSHSHRAKEDAWE